MSRLLQFAWLPILLFTPLLTAPRTMADSQINPLSSPSSEPSESLPESPPELQPEPAAQSLEQLPTGQYYYSSPQSSAKRPSFVLLRKSGRTVIGWDRRGASACFRGFASGNQIINATRVLAPYQPDSELQQGQTLDLNDYQITDHSISADEAAALRTCIGFFWR